MIRSVAETLDKKKVRYIRIDGGTASADRNEFVRRFQSDDKTLVALLSITAANSGEARNGSAAVDGWKEGLRFETRFSLKSSKTNVK